MMMIKTPTFADNDEDCDNDDANSLRKTDAHHDEDENDDKDC